MTKSHMLHAIIHTLLVTLCVLSFILNWLFIDGRIRMDDKHMQTMRETEDIFNADAGLSGTKKKKQ